MWLSVHEVLIRSERDRRPSFDIFVVCNTLISSGAWWHGISSFFWYYSRERGGEVSSRLGWLFWLNWNQGERFTMQLSCLLCLLSGWVGPCVPGVIEGSEDAALVWTKDEPRRISYWAVSHLESCQGSTMELLREIANGLNRFTIFAKKTPSRMLGWIPNASPTVGVVNVGCRWIGSAWNL